MTELKIASYNIRKAVGLDRKRDPARILSVLARIDADVVLLQEADRRLGARPTAIPKDMIASATDYVIAPLAKNGVSLGWHGNAILVRKGLTIEDTRRLELPGLEPRGAVLARVGGITFVGAHLGLLRRHRVPQMRALLDHLGDAAKTTVIGGDFNEWSRTNGFSPWADELTIVTPGHSFHARRPIGLLDRFAHGSGVALYDTGVLDPDAALRASDHLPIWTFANRA